MKANPTLTTKRLPVRKGVLKRLHAVTSGRKQRVAATANPADLDDGESGRKITTGLIVIVAFHVVAIALYFIHQRFIEGRVPEVEVVSKPIAAGNSPRTASGVTVDDLPRLAPGELSHRVEAGDTYAKIAFARGVEESALREANSNIPLRSGISLRVPPKTIVAKVPAEVTDLRANVPSADRGRVEPAPADITNGAPKAKLVKPSAPANTSPAPPVATPVREAEKTTPKSAGRSYTVQQGDNMWKISKRLKVDQDKLMKANGIEDARKLRVGMTLVVPN